MFEVLTVTGVSTCERCRTDITRSHGSSGVDTWHHDVNGREECPGSPTATPTEVLTAEHNHPQSWVSVPQGECPACDLYSHRRWT